MKFIFYHERKDFYEIHADTKERALEILAKASDNDTEDGFFTQSEVDMDWLYYGAKDDDISGEWLSQEEEESMGLFKGKRVELP